jgi:hypothetical protein
VFRFTEVSSLNYLVSSSLYRLTQAPCGKLISLIHYHALLQYHEKWLTRPLYFLSLWLVHSLNLFRIRLLGSFNQSPAIISDDI